MTLATPALPMDDDGSDTSLGRAVGRWIACAAIFVGVWGLVYAGLTELRWWNFKDRPQALQAFSVRVGYYSFLASSACWFAGGIWMRRRKIARNPAMVLAALCTLVNFVSYVVMFNAFSGTPGAWYLRLQQLFASLGQFAHILPLIPLVLWAKRVNASPRSVLRWLATMGLIFGAYTILALVIPMMVQYVRGRSWRIPPTESDVVLLLIFAASSGWSIAGVGLLRHRRRWSPAIMRIACWVWLVSNALNALLELQRLLRLPNPWWFLAHDAYSIILGAPYGIAFAVVAIAMLRRAELRAMFFSESVPGFRPIFKQQELAGV